jgi:hypothetical protein
LSRAKRVLAAVFTSALLVGVVSSPALASDHLANAISATGSNPVSGTPADPSTVPGEGSPNAGGDMDTPAVDLSLVVDRSGGHGNPQGG